MPAASRPFSAPHVSWRWSPVHNQCGRPGPIATRNSLSVVGEGAQRKKRGQTLPSRRLHLRPNQTNHALLGLIFAILHPHPLRPLPLPLPRKGANKCKKSASDPCWQSSLPPHSPAASGRRRPLAALVKSGMHVTAAAGTDMDAPLTERKTRPHSGRFLVGSTRPGTASLNSASQHHLHISIALVGLFTRVG